MTEHYFTANPAVGHKPAKFAATLRGKKYVFATDAGVFAKQGVDYGSRLLIETMRIPADARVLDIGCGYGPIGLAAASEARSGTVVMLDINERAVELAQENAKMNGITNVTVKQSNRYEAVRGEKFTHILSNPPIRAGKKVVHGIFVEAIDHLMPGGELWIVIQKKQGAPSALAKLQQIFPIVQEVAKDKGYRIYQAKLN
ncbi:MAG TPA: class I SAM-dependent methyltransferase [Bacilli bacterium]